MQQKPCLQKFNTPGCIPARPRLGLRPPPPPQVGIWLGKHKYMARSCDANTYYERSFEGSCCVFVVTVITVIMVFTVR